MPRVNILVYRPQKEFLLKTNSSCFICLDSTAPLGNHSIQNIKDHVGVDVQTLVELTLARSRDLLPVDGHIRWLSKGKYPADDLYVNAALCERCATITDIFTELVKEKKKNDENLTVSVHNEQKMTTTLSQIQELIREADENDNLKTENKKRKEGVNMDLFLHLILVDRLRTVLCGKLPGQEDSHFSFPIKEEVLSSEFL